MARTANSARTLPALPASTDAFAKDGTLGVELAGWLTAMSQLAAQGDERASRALIEACQTVPRLWEMLSTLSSLASFSSAVFRMRIASGSAFFSWRRNASWR